MRNSTASEAKTINERYERRERAKKLLIELERTSACLANAERLAPHVFNEKFCDAGVESEILATLSEARAYLSDFRQEVDLLLREPE